MLTLFKYNSMNLVSKYINVNLFCLWNCSIYCYNTFAQKCEAKNSHFISQCETVERWSKSLPTISVSLLNQSLCCEYSKQWSQHDSILFMKMPLIYISGDPSPADNFWNIVAIYSMFSILFNDLTFILKDFSIILPGYFQSRLLQFW